MRWMAAGLGLLATACSHNPEPPWFRDVAAETGIRFEHVTGASGHFYLPEIMGSGCALLDYDDDGDVDVFLIQGAPTGKGNRLFRNDLIPSGKLSFVDVTQAAGLPQSGYGMGAATGDFDNDGRIDLLVTSFGRNALFRNEGNGTFRDVTSASPDLALPGPWSTSASFFDYDLDGWQDLVILNYLDYSFAGNKQCYAPTGEPDYCTPRVYRALPSHLFHNEHGRFIDVSTRSGFDKAAAPGLGVAAVDANQDGWLDVFVANDSSANHLWINQKNGTFSERALQSGVAYGEEGLAKAGMGVAPGDYDNDGAPDLLVLNLVREGATLFHNNGQGDFTDVSLRTGIHALSVAFTGFGVGWFDFDRDGWSDLLMANGAVTMREEQRGQKYPFLERNLLLRNPGGGARFQDVSAQAGPDFARLGVTRGAAFGDIDNDGDIDILLNVNSGQARLLRNDLPHRNWLAVELKGPGLGLGRRVEVRASGLPVQNRWVRTDSSYLSASDPRVFFGLLNSNVVNSLNVMNIQRSALVHQSRNVKANVLVPILTITH